MNFGIEKKVALVTALSRGIGKAIAHALSKEGCTVVMCSRNIEVLEKAGKEISQNTGNPVHLFPMDLTKANDILDLVSNVVKKLGKIDILINNNGGPDILLEQVIDDHGWQDAFDKTFLSSTRMCDAVIPEMIKLNWGRIIFITSISVKQPQLAINNALRASVANYAKDRA